MGLLVKIRDEERVGRLAGLKIGEGTKEGDKSLPIDVGLPDGVIEAVEDVEEHVTDIARVSPVLSNPGLGRRVLTSICLGEGVSATPDGHGEDKEECKATLGSDSSADSLDIKSISETHGAYNLRHVVEKGVESLSSSSEIGTVDGVEVVGVEPIRGPEHGEEEDDEGFESDRLVESDELGLPGWVLHQNDSGTVFSDDITSVAEEKGENGTASHEDNEGNICTISDSAVGFNMDVLAKRNLIVLLAHFR